MSHTQQGQSLPPAHIPAPVAPKLNLYADLLADAAPGLVAGCYLTGSLALHAFEPQRSDVDFVAFLARPATAGDLAALRYVHQAVERAEPRWKLEGSYLQWGDLGRLPLHVVPGPYCSAGRFGAAGIHDLNPVTWWLLKNGGIPLLGPPPQELPFTVEWTEVTGYMRANLDTYWRQFTRLSPRAAWLLTDEGVEWAVLGICRPWVALRTGTIPAKVAAAEAMLAGGPPRWRRIVRAGLALRQGEPSGYRWRVQRAGEAMRFVQHVIAMCGTTAISHASALHFQ